MSYNKTTRIWKNHNLKIERKQFYNFTQAEATQKLKTDDELTFLLVTLDHKDFLVNVNDVHQTNKADTIVFLKATL